MPNLLAQNVSWIGMLMVPLTDKASNSRSASAGSMTLMLMLKPLAAWKRPGGLSDAISTLSPTWRRACMILSFDSFEISEFPGISA